MRRVTKIAIHTLKSVHDLHRCGFLHRDIKPDNIGLWDEDHPIAMLFDLGTCKIYTDEYGNVGFPCVASAYQIHPISGALPSNDGALPRNDGVRRPEREQVPRAVAMG